MSVNVKLNGELIKLADVGGSGSAKAVKPQQDIVINNTFININKPNWDGWTTAGSSLVVPDDDNDIYLLRMSHANTAYSMVETEDTTYVTPGQKFKLGVKARKHRWNVETEWAYIRVANYVEGSVSYYDKFDLTFDSDDTYKDFVFDYTVPDNVTEIKFGVVMEGGEGTGSGAGYLEIYKPYALTDCTDADQYSTCYGTNTFLVPAILAANGVVGEADITNAKGDILAHVTGTQSYDIDDSSFYESAYLVGKNSDGYPVYTGTMWLTSSDIYGPWSEVSFTDEMLATLPNNCFPTIVNVEGYAIFSNGDIFNVGFYAGGEYQFQVKGKLDVSSPFTSGRSIFINAVDGTETLVECSLRVTYKINIMS